MIFFVHEQIYKRKKPEQFLNEYFYLQERLGIYIKSVVPGGAADLDRRLQAGDQLLSVDGQSLIGITQERYIKHFFKL